MSRIWRGVFFAVIFLSSVVILGYWHIHSLVRVENQLNQYFVVYPNRYKYFWKLAQNGRWRDQVTLVFRPAERRKLLESGIGFVFLDSTFSEESGKYIIEFIFDEELLKSFLSQSEFIELAVNEQFMHRAWNEVVQRDEEVEMYLQIEAR